MDRWKCNSDKRLMENTVYSISPREFKENSDVNKFYYRYKNPIKWVSLHQSSHIWRGKSHLSSPFRLHENHLLLQIHLT